MFSNIEDIWTLSKAFLEKLEQRARSWQDKKTDEGHSEPIISDILIETVRLLDRSLVVVLYERRTNNISRPALMH